MLYSYAVVYSGEKYTFEIEELICLTDISLSQAEISLQEIKF